jgi:glycosyltransferase involved in cell wall biosynthesis
MKTGVRVSIVHDYLTQRGGAERVVLAMARAFPSAPVYTALYYPDRTYPDFAAIDVRVSSLNRVSAFRRSHRLSLPLLAPTFSNFHVPGDVVVCSSSGWAHGARVTGRKIVYCHTPAHWLYESAAYLRNQPSAAYVALRAMRQGLIAWDKRAARSADRYVTQSSAVRDRIQSTYGIRADLLPAPIGIDTAGSSRPVPGLPDGFFLCVSRLLPYKNVDALVLAMAMMPDEHLVLVGVGPEERRLRCIAPPNVTFLGVVPDDQLRWLYVNCAAAVSAANEDYGLTPLEAAASGRPSVVLRGGGFLDTVLDGETGIFFDSPSPREIAAALNSLAGRHFDPAALMEHASRFSEQVFASRLGEIVAEEAERCVRGAQKSGTSRDKLFPAA